VAPLVDEDGFRHGIARSTAGQQTLAMESVARRTAVATLVALGIVVLALALWKVKVVIALVFLGVIVAAAMRPGIVWLERRARMPRGLAVAVHYLVLLGLIGLSLWLLVPRAIDQVQQATAGNALHQEAKHSSGIKHDILASLEKRLDRLPSGNELFHPAVEVTKTAFEVLIGIFFVFAIGAYWIAERDKTIGLVQSLAPRKHRRVIRDTWVLIDEKLGAYVRGQLILIVFVAVLLSIGFFAIGLPYWLLIGCFGGVVEIVPVIGPLAAGALAVGVGLTQSVPMAIGAALIVFGVRMLEDYAVIPKVLGHATGLSPLVVLFSVTAVGILFGGFYVLLAIPIAAVLATLVDVVVRDVDPAEEDVPAVLFAGSREE
jgi:predicted PurR-regulated permease PerM